MKVKKIKAVFSENALLRSQSVSCWYGYMISQPFFTPWKMHMHMNLDHVASGYFEEPPMKDALNKPRTPGRDERQLKSVRWFAHPFS